MQAPCSGLKSVPPDSCPPEPQEVGLLGNTVFADVIISNHTGLGWALTPTSVLTRDRREHVETQSKPCGDGERCIYHQAAPRMVGGPRGQVTHLGWVLLNLQKEPTAYALTLDFRPPSLYQSKFLSSEATQWMALYCSSPGE